MALQVNDLQQLRAIWQIFGLHKGAGMLILLKNLAVHPSVQQRVKNRWTLSEEFYLHYPRLEREFIYQESKRDKLRHPWCGG